MARTLALWLVLIGLFFGLHFYYSAQPGGAGESGGIDFPVSTVVFQWGPILLVGAVALVVTRRRRATNRFSQEGAKLVERGRYTEALAQFEQFRARARSSPVGPYNLGLARLLLWQLEPAAAELSRAASMSARGRQWKELRGHSLVLEALAVALLGRSEGAKAVLARLQPTPAESAHLVLVRAVLACRAGDFPAALALLDRFEVKQLGGMFAALASALRAWCLERGKGELRHLDRVALFGETGPEALRAAWPELVEFLERAPAA